MLDHISSTSHAFRAAPSATPSPLPDPVPVTPPGSEDFVQIMNWVAWGVASLCILALFVVAGRMAMAYRNGEGYEAASGLAKVMVACVIIGSASSLVGFLV
ncbi:hypothetical protein OG858_47360 (plasmid) [Streptomyces europaeiscabiei]|uniref:hypothetical protein n=1 Tax=Streptomyces europaeiscabiei TaxID=146819 RepID=UPI002E80FFE6|nr:hypothetical protein [Streptomyces europaeiscabiei]WUD38819.1 hypothetical protein OG858_47360 [Streptomyces europaeiscabiei]